MATEDEFYNLDWIPIPNTSYIVKYVFYNSGYSIMVSDLVRIYAEKIEGADVQKRFSGRNSAIEMKTKVIIQNIRRCIEQILFHGSEVNLLSGKFDLCLKLRFPVAHTICFYNMNLDVLPPEKVLHYIIRPVILCALLSQRKVVELQKKIELKLPLSADVSSTKKNFIDPDWLKGSPIPDKILTDSFLNVQGHFNGLFAENCETYSIMKEKRESTSSPSISPKKGKHSENSDGSASIKFEDTEGENNSVKEEVDTDVSQQEPVKSAVKKRKVLKI